MNADKSFDFSICVYLWLYLFTLSSIAAFIGGC